MKEKLELLRKNLLVELSSWAGLSPTPGTSGTIITTDHKIYYYHSYRILKDNTIDESLSEGILINDEDYQKIEKYIEDHLNKDFEYIKIFDAGFTIRTKNKVITNHIEEYNELKKLIMTIEGEK